MSVQARSKTGHEEARSDCILIFESAVGSTERAWRILTPDPTRFFRIARQESRRPSRYGEIGYIRTGGPPTRSLHVEQDATLSIAHWGGNIGEAPPWIPDDLLASWRDGSVAHREHLSALTWDDRPTIERVELLWAQAQHVLRQGKGEPRTIRPGDEQSLELLPNERVGIQSARFTEVFSSQELAIDGPTSREGTRFDGARRYCRPGYHAFASPVPCRVRLRGFYAINPSPADVEPTWPESFSEWSR